MAKKTTVSDKETQTSVAKAKPEKKEKKVAVAKNVKEEAVIKPVKKETKKAVVNKTVKTSSPKKTALKSKENTSEYITPTQTPTNFYSRFTDFDISLFKAGKHFKLYEKMGSHVVEHEGVVGTYFAVWAPNGRYLSVLGNFNGWNRASHPMMPRWDGSGIWEVFIPNIGNGEPYKYFINSNQGEDLEKGDPYALRWEEPPRTASIVWDNWYEWKDKNWLQKRHQHNSLKAPWSVYELHFGSWARNLESPDEFLTYRQMADKLVPYVKEMGFTHVEFMPLMEHPYYPSWGYQIMGFFAATSRYGTPQDLMYLVDCLHEAEIGVIFDWVPSHFPGDAHAIHRFDGTHLYEHEDLRKGFHPDWKSYIFNYGRNEVRSFLISNALYWLDRFHADGLRVDAVASMLYLDYSRNHGEWEPNVYGGNHNLEAISFLKEFNIAVYEQFPDVQTIAEESTSFGGVSKPVFLDGLGFGMKWMMGWMNDTIKYFEEDPINRKYHHGRITLSTSYAFTENFMLPLSHDEVVYGKHSMIYKMPGDEWQKYANLRTLYTYMFTHPGTKLLFMGDEFAQTAEWNFQQSLDWHLLEFAPHFGMKNLIKDLNQLYKTEQALYEKNFSHEGFEWIVVDDAENSVLVYARKGENPDNDLIVAINLTPVPRNNYQFGVTNEGEWKEIFNSDDEKYWGSGIKNEAVKSVKKVTHYKQDAIGINLPPLAAIILKRV